MQKQYFALARKQQNALEDMPDDGEVKLEDSGGTCQLKGSRRHGRQC